MSHGPALRIVRSAFALGGLLCGLLVSGCLSPDTGGDAVGPMPHGATGVSPWSPLLQVAGCSAWNAFGVVPQEAVAPLVPANWTFTQVAPGLATLRFMLVLCPGESILVLATPMFTDAASQDHAKNPDVVLEVFATNATTVERFADLGADATQAQVDAQLGATWKVAVRTEAGPVLDLTLAVSPRHGSYSFVAEYAVPATAGPIGWYWGNETAPSFAATASYHVGSGSHFGGVSLVPYEPSSAWQPLDLRYVPGFAAK